MLMMSGVYEQDSNVTQLGNFENYSLLRRKVKTQTDKSGGYIRPGPDLKKRPLWLIFWHGRCSDDFLTLAGMKLKFSERDPSDVVSKLPESVVVAGSTITTTDELKILAVVLDSSLDIWPTCTEHSQEL